MNAEDEPVKDDHKEPGGDEPVDTPSDDAGGEADVETTEGAPVTGEVPAADPLDQPTEEAFAGEVGLGSGPEDGEDSDVYRSALLESQDSIEPAPKDPEEDPGPTGQPSAGEGASSDDDADADTGAKSGEPEAEDGAEPPVTREQTVILAAVARNEVNQAIETARQTGRAWDPPRPPVSGDFEEPPKGPRYLLRFALAAFLIVFSFAGATSASILTTVNDITGQLSDSNFENISSDVLPPANGGPQTIAIIGSDVRTGGGMDDGDPGRSDTFILMRLDPSTDQIAMLSIPRDLKVDIPGYGTDKFNAAYSYGGTKLALKTATDLTGLEINHVIDVGFQGFAEAIDAVGCVYVDIDRRYYNSNEGKAAAQMYAEIDIDAGYQKLCGPDALDFARYRHTDSDLARSARQQNLLGQVRNRLSFSEIIGNRKELIRAFTKNTRSDISGSKESLELLRLLFDSRNASVVQVPFPATLGPSFVTATRSEIQAAVDQFLGFEGGKGPVGTLRDTDKRRRGKKPKQVGKKRAKPKVSKKDDAGLVYFAEAGAEVAQGLRARIKRRDFSIYYPRSLPPGSLYTDSTRNYHVRDQGKQGKGAYRMVMALQKGDGLHYFGLQGLRKWKSPPILDAPHEEVKRGGRTFRLYTEGGRTRLVSWFDGGNTYWISNSILMTLSNEEMLAIASSTKAFNGG
jgi:LCP family protein required for cell wall assembly